MGFTHVITELKIVIAALFLGTFLGYFTGYWAISYAAILLGIILWFLSHIARLRKWMVTGALTQQTPILFGTANKIADHVCAIKKENAEQQQKLGELIKRFETATTVMPDAMLIVDGQQSIEWANPAADKILGIDGEKDKGERINNIIRDPVITHYLLAADYSQPLEFSSSRSEKNDLVLRVIPYGEGHKLLCVHDHTDLLRLQQVRKAFISNASHEMRTPLTVIIGYLETLILREDSGAATRKGIAGALEQAHRLNQLIEDLLSLSRLESLPLSQSQIEKVNLTEVVSESVDLVKASSMYREQQFQITLPEKLWVNGDYRELQSAVQNVIDNAVKYSAANTLITIEANEDTDAGLSLSIQDHGEGIEESHLMRLTERFYRVDKGRSRDMGGTGLGLSIVKHVIERHGGELLIHSELGIGTTVVLSFPISPLLREA